MARLPNPAVRQRWSRLIQLHHQSNLTVADFCDSQSISIASFYAWRRKMREPLEQDGEFLAVQITIPLSHSHWPRCASPVALRSRSIHAILRAYCWSSIDFHLASPRRSYDRPSNSRWHLPLQ